MRYLWILGIAIICLSLKGDTKCGAFKKGKFTSAYIERAGLHAILDRTADDIQVETIEGAFSGSSTYKIKWHSECNYTIYFVNTTFKEDTPLMIPGDSIQVVIQKILSNQRIAVESNFKGKIMHDTLTKID